MKNIIKLGKDVFQVIICDKLFYDLHMEGNSTREYQAVLNELPNLYNKRFVPVLKKYYGELPVPHIDIFENLLVCKTIGIGTAYQIAMDLLCSTRVDNVHIYKSKINIIKLKLSLNKNISVLDYKHIFWKESYFTNVVRCFNNSEKLNEIINLASLKKTNSDSKCFIISTDNSFCTSSVLDFVIPEKLSKKESIEVWERIKCYQ